MGEVKGVSQQIQAVRKLLVQLQQQAQSEGGADAVLAETVVELSLTLNSLEIATEDLTQQNQDLLRSCRRLDAERQRYESLFTFAPDAYLVTDDQGIIQMGNRAAERLLHVRREHLVGKPLILYIAEPDHQLVQTQLDEITQVLRFRPAAQEQMVSPQRSNPATMFLQDQEVTLIPTQRPVFPASLALSAEVDHQGRVYLYWVFRDLRERKRLEAEQEAARIALHTSEEQRRLALDLTQTGWWDWDILTNQLTWSNRLYQLLGYAPGEVIPTAKAWQNRIHPDDREWTSQTLQQDLIDHRVGTLEYRVIHPDGSLHWLLVKGQGIYDAAGQPIRMTGIALEITDRKQMEASLQESEARYRLLSEMSPLGIFRFDPAGRCTYVNERMMQLVGQPLEACLELNWTETIHPEDRQQVIAGIHTFMAEAGDRPDAIYQLECRQLHSNGQVVWVWTQLTPERDAAGAITGYIGTLTDITERKRLQDDLQLSEERLRLTLDLNQIGSWDWQPVVGMMDWNTHNYHLFGYEAGTVVPSYERWRDRVHPDDLDRIEQTLAEALIQQTDCEVEYRALLPDGTIRWLLSRGRGIYDAAGLLLRMVGVAFDITERKQTEAALQEQQRFVENIVATVPNTIYILDIQEHRNIYASQDGDADLGYTREEYEQWGSDFIARIMHPEDFQRLGELLGRWDTVEDDQMLEAEIRLQKKDGTWVWRWLREKVFLRDADGRVQQIIGTSQDITARKQAEAALLQRENFISGILGSITDVLSVLDETWCFTFVNSKLLVQTGLNLSDLIGQNIWEVFANMVGTEPYHLLHQAMRDRISVEYEFYYEPLQKWFGDRAYPTPDGGLAIYSQDITQRKQAEAALRESKARLRLAMKTAEIFSWEIDVLSERATWSDNAALVLGFPAELMPKTVAEAMRFNHPDDAMQVAREMEAALTGNQPRFSFEQRLIHPVDQSIVWVRAQGVVEQIVNGRPARLVGLSQNITDRKQAEAALRESEAKYRTLFDSMDEGYALVEVIFDENNSPVDILYLDANPAVIRMAGTDLIGKRTSDLDPNFEPQWFETFGRVAQTGVGERHEFYTAPVDGWYNFYVFKAGDPTRPQVAAIYQDVTDRKRREINAAFLAELMADFAYLSTAAEIMQVATAKTAAHFQASRCLLVEINVPADEARVIYNWIAPDLIDLVGTYRLPDFHTVDERQILSAGQPLIIPDTAALEPAAAERFRQLKIGALINAPYLSEGRWKFVLSVMQHQPRPWRNDEVELLQELAARIWPRLERATVETALRQSEERRRLATGLTDICTWDWDLDTGALTWSENGHAMLGLPPGSAPPHYDLWRERVHPADVERVEAAVLMHLQNQTLYSEEYRVIYPDGTIHWLFGKGRGVYDATGKAVRMVGITMDVTERKQLELSLATSEAKLSRILDSAIAVIVSFRVWDNRDWEYEYWSAGCEALYGYTVAEMRADKTLWLNQVFPEDRNNILMPLFEQFFKGENAIVEYRFRRKDGAVRWICSIYASEQIAPNCWMVTSVNYDVTDRKNLEQELLQINAELEMRVRARTLELEQAMHAAEAASRAKSAFLANMSHELRTPLNAILGFSQLLGRDRDLNPNQQEQVGIINRSGEHLLKLINDILEITKIEAGQASLSLSDLALERMLSDLRKLFRLQAEMKGVQLVIHCDDTVPRYIQADEMKLRQVLINLLSNAIKFTQTGTVTLRVQPGERRASRSADPPASLLLYFAVEDTGSGIDPRDQEAVFQPFVQTQTGYNAQEGSGLGLPISQEYVRLMGGELNFNSSPGVGTTFYFQIPVVPVAFIDRPEQPLPPQVIGLAPDQPTYRILIVEDNRENSQFLAQLLRSVGFGVQVAQNGQMAVNLWQQWQPDLIWMDMQMPIMNGYEATQQIRALELGNDLVQPADPQALARASLNVKPKTIIIALTASSFASERAAVRAAGCDDLVCKPVTAALVFEKIAEHLDVRYCYEEQTEVQSGNAEEEEELLLTALQTMPVDWIAQMRQTVQSLNEEEILQLLSLIPLSETLLTQTLKEWVNEFRFDKLIHLLDAIETD